MQAHQIHLKWISAHFSDQTTPWYYCTSCPSIWLSNNYLVSKGKYIFPNSSEANKQKENKLRILWLIKVSLVWDPRKKNLFHSLNLKQPFSRLELIWSIQVPIIHFISLTSISNGPIKGLLNLKTTWHALSYLSKKKHGTHKIQIPAFFHRRFLSTKRHSVECRNRNKFTQQKSKKRSTRKTIQIPGLQ